MQKHFIIIMISWGVIVLFLSSCVLLNVSTPTPSIPREEWITDWLEKPTCEPPCWEGITVGTSTMTDTVNILSKMDNLYIRGPRANDIGEGSYIAWEFPSSLSNGGAETDSNYANAKITKLYLNIDQTQLSLNLEEVIQVYGFPDYILSIRRHDITCQIDLIFEKGFALGLILPISHEKFEISPADKVWSISYFSNGIQGYKEEYGGSELNILKALKKWNGYTKYGYP